MILRGSRVPDPAVHTLTDITVRVILHITVTPTTGEIILQLRTGILTDSGKIRDLAIQIIREAVIAVTVVTATVIITITTATAVITIIHIIITTQTATIIAATVITAIIMAIIMAIAVTTITATTAIVIAITVIPGITAATTIIPVTTQTVMRVMAIIHHRMLTMTRMRKVCSVQ